MMRISVVGCGYVGTTLAACFSELGHSVVAVDTDESVVETLDSGRAPVHEPGLDELVEKHSSRRLNATTSYDRIPETEVTFLTVPTPTGEDGRPDTETLTSATRAVGEALRQTCCGHLLVVKSTVLPGTTAGPVATTVEEAADRPVDIAANPEFLSEGTAVDDFLDPDRIVLGTESESALSCLREVFRPLVDRTDPAVVETNCRTAEMIKYANNTFLASKVSFINELGNICKEYDIDTYEVAAAIGEDSRINGSFLRSGLGWGGSCFPKDTAALITAAREQGYDPALLSAAVAVNDRQPDRTIRLLRRHIDLEGSRVAVLGLAFKPETDDVRGSQSIPVIESLASLGASVVVHDPAATADQVDEVEVAETPADALRNAHGVVIATGWEQYSELDEEFDQMATPVVVDGRRVVERREGIVYEGLTW